MLALLALLTSTESCRRDVHTWFLRHGSGLLPRQLGLKQITTRLPILLRCVPAPVSLIDVGAGVHGLEKRWTLHATALHEDDSDALWLLGGFKGSAQVHAFEANPAKVAELQEAAASRSFTRNFTSFLHVHPEGVGAVAHSARLKMCGGPNSWTVDGIGAKGVDCKLGTGLTVTTLDAFAESLSAPLLYVKVDVEGGELDVVRGMERILMEKRVHLMSFEYALGWHKNFNLRHPLSDTEQLEVGNSSLRYFTAKMSGYGYDTFLINNGDRSTGVVLIPVYGRFWHDDFEVCFNREKLYGTWGQWCWNDLLVVRRDSHCVKTALFQTILPATKSQGRRGLVWDDAPLRAPNDEIRRATSLAFPSCESL